MDTIINVLETKWGTYLHKLTKQGMYHTALVEVIKILSKESDPGGVGRNITKEHHIRQTLFSRLAADFAVPAQHNLSGFQVWILPFSNSVGFAGSLE
ncbi:hypothetical protein L1987_51818 [Smallanthus sonchifolius]|uniref:Uncharacterized protein n=1 Tax=Smallanthus sonchifolius TaxID=185202 RepID=A0ACB9ES42_9ASTR|nr:hypothetical protein L1987_51818 [Smallanthus sonchifolius]